MSFVEPVVEIINIYPEDIVTSSPCGNDDEPPCKEF